MKTEPSSLPPHAVYCPYSTRCSGSGAERGVEEEEGRGDIAQTVQAAPDDGSAGMAIAFAAEKATELSHHAHRLAQRRRRLRRLGGVLMMARQRFPLRLGEEHISSDLTA